MPRYVLTVGVALSVLTNALTGGQPLETVSYRSAKARAAGKRWGCLLCRFLDRLDPDHCQNTLDRWSRHFRKDEDPFINPRENAQ